MMSENELKQLQYLLERESQDEGAKVAGFADRMIQLLDDLHFIARQNGGDEDWLTRDPDGF